uniref:Proteasome subunit alpha type-2-like n=1 Tax=Dermatophagoides pteronyssinus TaxID=6956 RepID=A0A6P6YL04_DERPT|nr:proteasome subunit alpha type-2-like [Dermatophagoides pteronyssinus]
MSNDYGFSLTTFSPTGKLGQIDRARKAVSLHGALAVGMSCDEGAVMCVEYKKLSPLIDISKLDKLETIGEHIGVTYSGMPADFHALLTFAREKAVKYERTYGQPIPVLQLVKKLADLYQEHTQSGAVRPFGCALLLCGVDDGKCKIFQVDPSGTFLIWKASAIGKMGESAMKVLERRYRADMSLEDAVHAAILTMKEHAETQLTSTSLCVGVCERNKFTLLRPDEFSVYLGEGGEAVQNGR